MIKPEKDEIAVSWHKLQLLMFDLKESSRMSDPIALFRWETIGLKWVHKAYQGSYWYFKVIDKKKLSFTMIRHGFTLDKYTFNS